MFFTIGEHLSQATFVMWILQSFKNNFFMQHLPKTATRGGLWKKVFLEISQNSQKITSARASFLIKLQAWGLQLFQKPKEALAQVFSGEFCEISRNNLFTEHLWTTASDLQKQSFADVF